MVSGTGAFVVDPLGPVCWEVEPPCVGLVLALPTDARLDWDLGILEA